MRQKEYLRLHKNTMKADRQNRLAYCIHVARPNGLSDLDGNLSAVKVAIAICAEKNSKGLMFERAALTLRFDPDSHIVNHFG